MKSLLLLTMLFTTPNIDVASELTSSFAEKLTQNKITPLKTKCETIIQYGYYNIKHGLEVYKKDNSNLNNISIENMNARINNGPYMDMEKVSELVDMGFEIFNSSSRKPILLKKDSKQLTCGSVKNWIYILWLGCVHRSSFFYKRIYIINPYLI